MADSIIKPIKNLTTFTQSKTNFMETQLAEFLLGATTRNGSAHTYKKVLKNAYGAIVSITGAVTIENEQRDTNWNVDGTNVNLGEPYSLVTAVPFTDWIDENTASETITD